MWGKRLPSEEGTIVGDRGFKAFGIDTFLREPALFRALIRIADAGDAAEDIAKCTPEDVAFVSGHLQGLLDGVGEAVVGEVEVWEHDYGQDGRLVGSNGSLSELRTNPTRAASIMPAK